MTADIKMLPLPEMDIYALGSGMGLRDVRQIPVGFSQNKMSEYARANVVHHTAAHAAEIERLRAEVDRWKSNYNEAIELKGRAFAESDRLREDAERYRWLKSQNNEDFSFSVVKNPHFDVYDSAEELDAAIDDQQRGGA